MSRVKHLKKFVRDNAKPILFVAGFAVVGAVTIFLVRAASPSAAFEAENATLAGVTQVNDASASAGKAVQFGNNTGATGVAACDPSKGLADEMCWYLNTGVLNTTTTGNPNDRWTAAQIRSGAASAQIQNVGSAASPAHVVLNTPGQVYSDKNVVGCIDIQADNVTVRNVLLTIDTDGPGCPYAGITTHPAGSGATMRKGFTLEHSEIDGGYSTACAIPPWSGTACPEVYNITGLPMNLTGPMKLDQVNDHGGYAFIGYMAGSQIVNSYLHDWGHMHKNPQGDPGNGTSLSDFHHDIIWAQGQSNFSVKHSFGLTWHPWPGRYGESGGCLCNNDSSNWAFIDTYWNGYANVDIAGGDGAKSKIVALNLYGGNTTTGGIWQIYPYAGSTPSGYPDYGAGAWTEAYSLNSTYGQMIPVIDHSRCTGIYSVSAGGVASKVGC